MISPDSAGNSVHVTLLVFMIALILLLSLWLGKNFSMLTYDLKILVIVAPGTADHAEI